MEFRWHDIDADPLAWDRLVSETRQSLFHLSRLLRVHAFGRTRRRGVILSYRGYPMAVVGGLVRRETNGDAFESLCFPSLMRGRDDLLEALIGWLRDQGISKVRFGSFSGGVEGYPLDCSSFAVSERLEFPWEISEGTEALRRKLRSNHKRKLNKLDRRKLTLKAVDRRQAWLLTCARAQWAQRKGQRLQVREFLHMYRYHRLLHKHLTTAGIGNLYGLYDEQERLLSLAYMLEYSDLSFYMIGASSPEGYRINASMKLFWDMARFYSEQGFRYLHLGGVPSAALAEQHDEHGVYRFKQGFGVTPAVRLTLSTHS
ncbi:hypothetical protein CAI21_19900 [Alkalilimnicola ehrlichii]|uniref:BioF2-like acetyltransferase domain-containing protein n=1 Tax=Alkalilimnicola ehrlichii TaxID=351052 RepID=A0A3E0WGU8_9GAMM|nr:GNAT family N-acetyltransferase [Alkalilimnicola ehrlichii]RFA25160.1 hypothetical protein CAI21_19900 [Alkalilimnicola ehrlichii]RFA32114.1 hypothetical protein CAL65_20480 [Alkalilimnicola ehrlichii]